MTDGSAAQPSRLERRKARTRAALVRAARTFIAENRMNAPVLEITRAADVGMGSFYNHFDSKEELFQAAVDDALEAHGHLLDELTGEVDDPAEVFAQAFRLTGRLHRVEPELSRVLLANGPALMSADHGLAPRALRDIEAAAAAGRFTVGDVRVALALAAGAVVGLGQLLHSEPDRDDAETTDEMTVALLRAFGMTGEDARAVCSRPLPGLPG
ncbi:TetR/AcrR family transcriptional regulator [Nocardia shimofusensis]|uniref:TetR/AcrR family transcriptional regulator n=1 Tax=Nocardia shimofusensis TaxID=228596 RepID=UPI000834B77C|nr:TetR/AcrR family transcriptional regulator [Nocardia shimofusensis]